MKSVRCAIYTRKSSDEGLDQAFNSLDAQREACAAYILSQASEGWTALPDIYDDGGLSGGTLERPALRRLLSEISAGRIDTVVVYKVDRLTRSLHDFSKLVEVFDKAGASFVSVTQSFNTTTSMGRLTLNMLLSFAQFEREVTAERIRDKIAASKARGMWMGGNPPLGYAPDGRSLKIVEPHAKLVRDIFDLYLELGNVRSVAERLEQGGVRSPTRISIGGKNYGGGHFTRGQIYGLLKCPTYVGEIHHRDNIYPALFEGIVDREIWDRTQAMLAGNLQGHRSGARAASPSLLAGKIVDAAGQPLLPTHANKGKTRYRYYVSRDLLEGTSTIGMRIPAVEIEAAVRERVGTLFDDGLSLIATAWLLVAPSDIGTLSARCADVAPRGRATMLAVVRQVRVHDSRIEVICSTAAIAVALNVELDDDAPETITIQSDVRLTRSGRAMRLVQSNGAPVVTGAPNPSLIKLLIKARRWWARLQVADVDIKTLARLEGVQAAYITRVVRLAFLAPAVVDGILAGTVLPEVDGAALTATGALPSRWHEQEAAMLPRRMR